MGEDPPLAVRPPRAFEDFYRSEFASVVGLAFALSGSRSGAEDIAQEAFLAAYRIWPRVSVYERPEAWVRRVVANKSVSFFRRRGLEVRALAKMAIGRHPSLPDLPEEDAEFWATVRSLPKRQAQVIALHYLEDVPVSQIGQILGLAEGTVKAHLHAARKNLVARLGAEEEEP
ncbi:MAG TPA: sigma-70 family RNA polymerase sigma factor [Actinomycetota bacterium]